MRERELMIAGLRRVLEEPGVKLFGGGRSRGVFAQRTLVAERAASQLLEHRLLETDADGDSCRLTPQGLQWLAEHNDSKILLEDLLRAAENQQDRLRRLETLFREECDRLAQQRAAVSAVLHRLAPDEEYVSEDVRYDEAVLECLKTDSNDSSLIKELDANGSFVSGSRKKLTAGPMTVSTVEQLYLAICRLGFKASVGRFHDSLRRLHSSNELRLTPWTGPLFELPKPELALLIGHEVLYYVERNQHSERLRTGSP